MTILLYDYVELEERGSKSYKLWKGCHITSYVLAAVFGLLNFYFLQQTMLLFAGQCVLSPHELVFRAPTPANDSSASPPSSYSRAPTAAVDDANSTAPELPPLAVETSTLVELSDQNETSTQPTMSLYNVTVEIVNVKAVNAKSEEPAVVDPDASKFRIESYCDMPRYTPLVSFIFGAVWCTLFIVCPAGGRSKRGLREPWRIIAPAIVFALVLVFLAGHSFLATDRGLQAFCSHFRNHTNTTSCTSRMDAHVAAAAGAWAPASVAVGATRAACAGVWACWAAACALLLARCLAGADFSLRRTEVRLVDPSKKLQPLLNKDQKHVTIVECDVNELKRNVQDSPVADRKDGDSMASEPTLSTELNTASGLSDGGRYLNNMNKDSTDNARNYIELTYSPQMSTGRQ